MVIVDAHTIVRNNTEKARVPFAVFLNGNILQNYSTICHGYSQAQNIPVTTGSLTVAF